MSITSAKTGATGISLALDNNYMEPIATTVVGSGGSNRITFNDIPQIYKHLQVRLLIRTDRGVVVDYLKLNINSDNGANYANHYLRGNSGVSAAQAGATADASWAAVCNGLTGNTALSNVFGAGIIDILDYTNTNKYKTLRGFSGEDRNNDAGYIYLDSSLWMNTSAINSITFTPGGGNNFMQYSRFSLYGVKG